MTLANDLARMSDGDAVRFEAYGLAFTVRYRTDQAYGDNGLPVRGDETGEFTVFNGDRPVKRQHVAPHGTSPYGNRYAKTYAAEQVAAFITDRFLLAKRQELRAKA